MIPRGNGRDIDVDPCRKKRVSFDHRTKFGQWHRVQIPDKKYHMRVADIDRAGTL